jgi:ribosomal protein S18 acetylase RimI-like enzyme
MSSIQKLTRDYLLEYKELRLRALQTDPQAYFATYEEVSRWPNHFFESEINAHAGSDVFGYYGYFDLMGKLRGYVNLSPSFFSTQSHIADLYNLYVQPEYRHQKIASYLMDNVIGAAQYAQLETIFLSVLSANVTALALYQKYGFIEYARKERSVKSSYQYLDEILMRKDLATQASSIQ